MSEVIMRIALAVLVLVGSSAAVQEEKNTDKTAEAIKSAINFLLTNQDESGCWGKKKEHLGGGDTFPAVTALGLLGIMAISDLKLDEESSRKLSEATDKAKKIIEGFKIETGPVKSYWLGAVSWNNTYVLQYKLAEDKKDKETIQKIVEALQKSQEESGGWAYSYKSPGCSFQTATAIIALLQAKQEGFDISDKTIEKGIKYLKKLKTEQGFFRYSGRSPNYCEGEIGSCGRNIVCSLALYLAGECKIEELQSLLSNMFFYRKELEIVRKGPCPPEKRRRLSHWGEQGVASYYYFFDHFYVVQALLYLDKDTKIKIDPKYDEKTKTASECIEIIKNDLVAIQEKDGGWKEDGGMVKGSFHSCTVLALGILSGKKIFDVKPKSETKD